MISAYSKMLAAGSGNTAGARTLFTVPAGRVYVVTDICLYTYLNAAGDHILISDAGRGVYFHDAVNGVSQSTHWVGRQTFAAGDSCGAYIGAGTWYWRLSGYNLTA